MTNPTDTTDKGLRECTETMETGISITPLSQPNLWTCGASVAAMIVGKGFEDFYSFAGHDGSEILDDGLPRAFPEIVIWAYLLKHGYKTGTVWIEGEHHVLREVAETERATWIVRVNSVLGCHYLILDGDKVYDPSEGTAMKSISEYEVETFQQVQYLPMSKKHVEYLIIDALPRAAQPGGEGEDDLAYSLWLSQIVPKDLERIDAREHWSNMEGLEYSSREHWTSIAAVVLAEGYRRPSPEVPAGTVSVIRADLELLFDCITHEVCGETKSAYFGSNVDFLKLYGKLLKGA